VFRIAFTSFLFLLSLSEANASTVVAQSNELVDFTNAQFLCDGDGSNGVHVLIVVDNKVDLYEQSTGHSEEQCQENLKIARQFLTQSPSQSLDYVTIEQQGQSCNHHNRTCIPFKDDYTQMSLDIEGMAFSGPRYAPLIPEQPAPAPVCHPHGHAPC